MPEMMRTAADALVLVFEFVAMIVLGTVGFLAESAGVAQLSSGFDPVVVWLCGMGAVAMYAGLYMIGYQRILPRVLPSADDRQV